jgi:Arc/MetJ family transcription regulator
MDADTRAGLELTDTHKCVILTHRVEGTEMRTNIEIDDRLMHQAMRAGKGRTKRAVVEAGLRLLVQIQSQARIRRLRGKVRWAGDLEVSRQGRLAE